MSSRVQVVVSGKFIVLLLAAVVLLGGGYYWYAGQQQTLARLQATQERFKTPPYFVNRGASIIRTCGHCLEAGKLRPQPDWRIGPATEIQAAEQRWFLAVEDPPLPVTVSGVLMLPAHPAFQDNPSFGFDQTKVMLVLFQNLERKTAIEQPSPTPPIVSPSDPPPPSTQDASRDDSASSPSDILSLKSPFIGNWRNADPNTENLTKLLIIESGNGLTVHAWGRCNPSDCDWGLAPSVPMVPADGTLIVDWNQRFVVRRLDLLVEQDGRLKATLKSHFTDNPNRPDSEFISFFTKNPAP